MKKQKASTEYSVRVSLKLTLPKDRFSNITKDHKGVLLREAKEEFLNKIQNLKVQDCAFSGFDE